MSPAAQTGGKRKREREGEREVAYFGREHGDLVPETARQEASRSIA